jgi:hypothetical protein
MKPVVFLWLLLISMAPHLITPARAAEFYVAPDGNDGNDGTRSKPFATPERARDRIRLLRQEQKGRISRITIWIRGGDYVRTNAFELAAADSGTTDAPVTWRAVEGETVRWLGGRRLAGFKTVSDPAILARLKEDARRHVVELDLRSLGIADCGELKSRGFSRPIVPSHSELFFDGKPMELARWPDPGAWEQIAGFPSDRAQDDGHGGKIGRLEDGFFFSGDRPRSWKDTGDIWVHGYWAWDWANSYERVVSIDPKRRLIRTAAPHGLYGFRKGQRFYFLNVLEELDQPGEWYLDRKAGRLYFWPPSEIGTRTEILLSLLAQPLLKLTDVSHVVVRGLTFEATRGNGVEIRGGSGNRVEGCVLRNMGNNAVTVEGGSGHGVQSCDIFDTGDGGVRLLGGDRRTLAPGGHFVDNCHFARQGRWSKCYVPAVLMEGVGLRASHNLIHDHPHCAILFGGNDHRIEFNEIHRIALETGDVGAIYAGRDYTYRGNRIRHNYIHHTGGVGMGSMGIYMDDCVSGAEIYGNIFYRVQRAAFLGGGRDHEVINNVFVECDPAVQMDGRGLDPSPTWREMVDQTMRQRLNDVPHSLYRERYPELLTLDRYYGVPGATPIVGADFKGVPPENNRVERNVCVGKWLIVAWHATESMLRLENNLTDAQSSFEKAPGESSRAVDFAFKADSSAGKLGFAKIPTERIGLYQDAMRGVLP